MTTTTFTFEQHILKAHLLTAAAKDIRPYLVGVHVDVANRRLVSTDGHVMLVTRFADDCVQGDPCESFIIGRDQLTLGLKACAKRMPAVIQYVQPDEYMDEHGQSCKPAATLTICNLVGKPIDAKYPDYHRIVPVCISNEVAHFNSELVNRVSDALRLVRNSDKGLPTLFHNGKNAGVMILDSEAFGLVMPLRSDATSGQAVSIMDDIMRRNQSETTAAAA